MNQNRGSLRWKNIPLECCNSLDLNSRYEWGLDLLKEVLFIFPPHVAANLWAVKVRKTYFAHLGCLPASTFKVGSNPRRKKRLVAHKFSATPLKLEECTVPIMKDLNFIYDNGSNQEHSSTLKVWFLISKNPCFALYRGQWAYLFWLAVLWT